jgi:predicted acetyltransferase
MDIVTFRELEDKDDFMMLMDLAFWWPITPGDMQERMTSDIRLKDGPVGFCAVEDNRLIGYVGVMDIPTRTSLGEIEKVGGIWAVATNPASSRRGICKTLMEKAHQYFKLQGYRFSFLCTGRTIIAYRIYKEMKYEEVEAVNQLVAAYKVLGRSESPQKSTGDFLDPEKIYRMYEKYAEGKVGFVVRQPDFVTMYARRKRLDEKISILKTKGYALLLEGDNVIKVRDMVALDYDTYGELIDETENRAQNGVINGSIDDERLVELYRSKGYRIQEGHNGVMMVKTLQDARFNDVYGSSFHIGALDWF